MSPFRILTVCTGNICRSPLSEIALRHYLSNLNSVEVFSAGTRALVGQPMDTQNAEIAEQRGISGSRDHVARQLTAEQIESADLILALAREHRRFVVELVPSATQRTFTLREFARLAQQYSQDSPAVAPLSDVFGRSLDNFVLNVAAQRGDVRKVSSPTDDDVIDPYRLDSAVFAQQANEILPAAEICAAFIQTNIENAY